MKALPESVVLGLVRLYQTKTAIAPGAARQPQGTALRIKNCWADLVLFSVPSAVPSLGFQGLPHQSH